jgi:hypothetical protein
MSARFSAILGRSSTALRVGHANVSIKPGVPGLRAVTSSFNAHSAALVRWTTTATGTHEKPSSAASQTAQQASSGQPGNNVPAWVTTMNTALKNHPVETGASFMFLDMLCVLGTYALITKHLTIPMDFVFAFAMNRVLRKPRLPLDIAMAGAVARFFPSLTKVRVTAGLPQLPLANVDAQGQERKNPLAKAALKAGQALRTGIDRYGICLLVSQRMIMNLLTIGLSYSALRAGLDLDGLLTPLFQQEQLMVSAAQEASNAASTAASTATNPAIPAFQITPTPPVAQPLEPPSTTGTAFAESVASAAKAIAGPMAAAVAMSSFFYPAVIYGSAVGGLKLGKLRSKMQQKPPAGTTAPPSS